MSVEPWVEPGPDRLRTATPRGNHGVDVPAELVALDTYGASLAEQRSMGHRGQTGASPGGEMNFKRAVEA